MNSIQNSFTVDELTELLLTITEQEEIARYKTLDIERFNNLAELYNILRYGQRKNR